MPGLSATDRSGSGGFSRGQYVELVTTIPSSAGGSVASGTRGIVDDVDLTRPDADVYLVALLANELRTGQAAWLGGTDVRAA